MGRASIELLFTKMKSTASGRRARIVKVVEMTTGGRFSGSLNSCCVYT